MELLAHLPQAAILDAYAKAAGRELDGKANSPESSSALVANTLGYFLDRPSLLPPLPGLENAGWPALSVALEVNVRFPWPGGRHPWLDALVETSTVSGQSSPLTVRGPVSTGRLAVSGVWKQLVDAAVQMGA